jgi:hypothetical protein
MDVPFWSAAAKLPSKDEMVRGTPHASNIVFISKRLLI